MFYRIFLSDRWADGVLTFVRIIASQDANITLKYHGASITPACATGEVAAVGYHPQDETLFQQAL